MDIHSSYLGINLRSPLVMASSPLTREMDNFNRLEDAGISAIVLHSLFEMHSPASRANYEFGSLVGADGYAEQIAAAKMRVRVPVIASLSCNTLKGWLAFTRLVESAGADAIELNIHSVPPELDLDGSSGEDSCYEIISAVRSTTGLPLAVKLSPYFTNLANVAASIERLRVQGLVLFNRFYHDDIDIESRTPDPGVLRASDMDNRLPLHWIGILYRRVAMDFAASSGIRGGGDVIKMIMAGANVTMLCGILMERGIDHLRIIERDMVNWLDDHGCLSLEEIRGVVSQHKGVNPSVFEQARYFRNIAEPTSGFAPAI